MMFSRYKIVSRKIRSTSLGKLIIIVLFKLLRKVEDVFEQIRLKVCNPRISFVKTSCNISNFPALDVYLSLCNDNVDIIKYADLIINGHILLFGKLYEFNQNDWLKDPISGKFWEQNLYFTKAPVEKNGFGDVKYVMEKNKLYHLVALAQAYYQTHDDLYILHINRLLDSHRSLVKYDRSVVNKSMLDLVYRAYNLIHIVILCFRSNLFKSKMLDDILIDIALLEIYI